MSKRPNEACGDDLDALLTSYQARADHKPPQRGKTTPATIIDAERPAAEPAAVATQETAAKPRASVTRAIMAFDNTPFAKRDERLAFAARALRWEVVESFTDLDDKALEVVTKALHAEMRQRRDAAPETSAPQTPAPQVIADQKPGPDWTAMKTVADARNFLESTAQALDVPEPAFNALIREFGGINRETAPGIYDRLAKLAPHRASESDEPAGNPAAEVL
ncbi:MAG: hypothetical protein GIW94_15775 [Candidatus Eremiobacteraeota bacterium]|nr:hypothetical protein [Candidatus Eremiobacteraeota bacterium]MBC5822170.1 hypothetical protein [Candidatus Eremiobacteraeota bacterium]